jgi:hypothetical protein
MRVMMKWLTIHFCSRLENLNTRIQTSIGSFLNPMQNGSSPKPIIIIPFFKD